MKSFFKIFFASMFGFVAGIFLLFILFIVIVSVAVSGLSEDKVVVTDGSVLHFELNMPVAERTSKNPFENFDFGTLEPNNQPGLNDILKAIRNAAADTRIKGIYIDLGSLQAGMATASEIRDELLAFKKSGKFIYAYADVYSQGAYYLASVADRIYMNPEGAMLLNGLASEIMFFKGSLEKLEVEPQVIRHGKFKSAIEPYILDKMSEENKAQVAAFVNPIWEKMITDMASSRKMPIETVRVCADSMKIRNAQDALAYKFVDKLAYYDEFMAEMNKNLGKKAEEKLPLIGLGKYAKAPATIKEKFSSDKVAVIYAVGTIENGEGSEQSIGSDKLSAALRKARTDEKIKAVVLRVNSPGGDALASEEIWREVLLTKKAKPLIVSMGDVAASGGYYISCAADAIVAQPNTITGSIGVFGLLFNAQDMLKNKLGITTDTYKTGTYTDMGTITRPLTDGERMILQQEVDRVYDVFTSRVATGRKMAQSAVDSIGQGRVWDGGNALRLGLADTLGGIETAIAMAVKKAGLKEYRTISLPEQKDPLESIMSDLATEARLKLIAKEAGDFQPYFIAGQSIMKLKGIQALCPFTIRNY